VAYYLSLSKSTDGGESFTETLRSDRGLWIENERLFVDESDNVHILRDSTTAEPSVVYTKLFSGNPTTRIDTFIPPPVGPPGFTFTDDVDFWIEGDSVVHYACEVQRYNGSEWEEQVEYSWSSDGGLTFAQLAQVDTLYPPIQADPNIILTNSGLLLITYRTALTFEDFRLRALVSEDGGSTFESSFELGTYEDASQVNRLAVDSTGTYVFSCCADSSYGMVYEQYFDPRDPPADVATFDSLVGDLAIGMQGEKYSVMRATATASTVPPYLFFSSKDIPASVNDPDSFVPSMFTIRAAPNPFNSSTTLHIELPTQGIVQVDIVDIRGRRVHTEREEKTRGSWSITFAAAHLASGVYLARALFGDETRSLKLLLLK
jgi:hypothetical protein